MSFASDSRGAHPAPEMLALYARGDLGFFSTLRLRLHLAGCATCEQSVDVFCETVRALKGEAAGETLTAFEAIADWKRLEPEMLGNIVVGVAAARCIENVGRTRARTASVAVGVGAALLFVLGWITHIPGPETSRLISSITHFVGLRTHSQQTCLLQATPSGIEVDSQGVSLTILHPASAYVSLSGNSSVQARYVDDESGQLTITSVYGQ